MKITPKTKKIKRRTTGRRLEERGGASDDALLYLYSNNSIENSANPSETRSDGCVIGLAALLSPYHKKSAHRLYSDVERLIKKEAKSPNHIGFLTLTFPDNVTDHKEASRRFNSLRTNFLSQYSEFGHWLCVVEQQKRGAWHFHLLVCLEEDVKTGVNFDEFKAGRYTSASPYLRRIWSDLREAMPKYKFGRSELLPIRKSSEAMGRYIGKYISKHMGQRDEGSKGVRLVRYSQGWVRNSIDFAWYNKNSKQWREKLSIFARLHGCTEFYQLSQVLGPNWAYLYAQSIFDIEPLEYKIEGLPPEKPYKDKTIKRLEDNLKAPSPLDRRKIERGKRKSKIVVDRAKSGMLEYYECDDLEKNLKESMEADALARYLESAHRNKSFIADMESLEIPLNTHPIEVPF